jgi:hypothetical protein
MTSSTRCERWNKDSIASLPEAGQERQLLEFKCVEFVEELMYGHLRKKTGGEKPFAPALAFAVAYRLQ